MSKEKLKWAQSVGGHKRGDVEEMDSADPVIAAWLRAGLLVKAGAKYPRPNNKPGGQPAKARAAKVPRVKKGEDDGGS